MAEAVSGRKHRDTGSYYARRPNLYETETFGPLSVVHPGSLRLPGWRFWDFSGFRVGFVSRIIGFGWRGSFHLNVPKEDYRKKVTREAGVMARRMRQAGHPEPLGDPSSGIVIVVDQPIGPRIIEALRLSLETIQLSDSYVTWASTGLLLEELLSLQPSVLVSIGPGADRELDSLNYPLSRNSFSEATPGVWFPWTSSVSALSLPALSTALDDEAAKRTFWRAFLALQRRPLPSR